MPQLQYGRGEILELGDEEILIGRSPQATICTRDDRLTAARHARIVRDGSTYVIEHLGGHGFQTLVGDETIERRLLSNRDVIQIGSLQLQYWV